MQNKSNSIQYIVLDISMEFGGQQAFHADARETSYGDKSALWCPYFWHPISFEQKIFNSQVCGVYKQRAVMKNPISNFKVNERARLSRKGRQVILVF